MKKDCAINFDHIQTVSKNKIGPVITTLSPEKLKMVSRAIQFAPVLVQLVKKYHKGSFKLRPNI